MEWFKEKVDLFFTFFIATVVGHSFIIGLILLGKYIFDDHFDIHNYLTIAKVMKWYIKPLIVLIAISFISVAIFHSLISPITLAICYFIFMGVLKFFIGDPYYFSIFANLNEKFNSQDIIFDCLAYGGYTYLLVYFFGLVANLITSAEIYRTTDEW